MQSRQEKVQCNDVTISWKQHIPVCSHASKNNMKVADRLEDIFFLWSMKIMYSINQGVMTLGVGATTT